MRSILGREDPFFGTRHPHRRSFLESLHRTYGEPKGALPARNEAAFARALQFRQQEKARYSAIEADNERMKSEVEQLNRSRAELVAETERIKQLWEQLSKAQVQDVPIHTSDPLPVELDQQPVLERQKRAPTRGGAGKGVRPRASRPARNDDRVVQSAETGSPSGGGGGVSGVEQAPVAEAERADDGLRREVLPASVPDVRRQTSEHPAERPERGRRAVQTAEGGDSKVPVPEDEDGLLQGGE